MTISINPNKDMSEEGDKTTAAKLEKIIMCANNIMEENRSRNSSPNVAYVTVSQGTELQEMMT